MTIDILLTGTMGEIAGVVRRALESEGLTLFEMPFEQNTFRDLPGYRRELQKTLKAVTPKMIIPVGASLSLALSRDIIPDGIYIPIDKADTIKLLDSKVQSSALAASLDIRQPRMFDTIPSEECFPLIFKRDISFGGHGVHKPTNPDALRNLIEHQSPGEPFLIEEFIPGQDFSVDALRWDGYFRANCYRTLQKQGNGPSVLRENVESQELIETTRKILDAVDYHGVCGIDFKVDDKGNAYFLECNPRFTGGLESDLAAGFNVPFSLWILCSS